MSQYQGRALDRSQRERGRSGPGPWRQALRVLAVMLGMGTLAMLPWKAMRERYAVLTHVKVAGIRYLDASRIQRESTLRVGQDLFSLDLASVRRHVLEDPRVEDAQVRRRGLRGVEVRIADRVPALVVANGEPWEIDTTGVLLEPLQRGVVADVPLLTGADLSKVPPGTRIRTPQVQRGLAWAAVLSDNALRLAGQVSELDVSEPRTTRLVLMNGIRVVAPAWPVTTRQLSGLRATLLDLQRKGMTPAEVDVRFPDQVIVRDAQPAAVVPAEPHNI